MAAANKPLLADEANATKLPTALTSIKPNLKARAKQQTASSSLLQPLMSHLLGMNHPAGHGTASRCQFPAARHREGRAAWWEQPALHTQSICSLIQEGKR